MGSNDISDFSRSRIDITNRALHTFCARILPVSSTWHARHSFGISSLFIRSKVSTTGPRNISTPSDSAVSSPLAVCTWACLRLMLQEPTVSSNIPSWPKESGIREVASTSFWMRLSKSENGWVLNTVFPPVSLASTSPRTENAHKALFSRLAKSYPQILWW